MYIYIYTHVICKYMLSLSLYIYIYIYIFCWAESPHMGVAPSRNVSVFSLHLTLASWRRCSGIEETQRGSKVAPATKPKRKLKSGPRPARVQVGKPTGRVWKSREANSQLGAN